jgi:hypothetical protein
MTQEHTIVQFDAARLADYALAVDVGSPFSHDGETRAVLSGTGAVVVEHLQIEGDPAAQRDRKPEQVGTYQMGPEATRQAIATAAAFPWRAEFPSRPGIPDEAVVTWTLSDSRNGQTTLKAWLEDVNRDERMAPVIRALRQAVDAATGGRYFL